MDEAERERLKKWLDEKWDHGPCPVCAAAEWEPQPKLGQIENLAMPVLFPEGGAALLSTDGRVPALLVTCQNCGYFVAVNAIVAGIRRPGDPGLGVPED
jgi:hypothetical protein